jgi:exonuclease I
MARRLGLAPLGAAGLTTGALAERLPRLRTMANACGYGYDGPCYDDCTPRYSSYYYRSYYGRYGCSPYYGGYSPGYWRAFLHYW